LDWIKLSQGTVHRVRLVTAWAIFRFHKTKMFYMDERQYADCSRTILHNEFSNIWI